MSTALNHYRKTSVLGRRFSRETGAVQKKKRKSVSTYRADTDTSCASSLDERVGRLTDDEDGESPRRRISMLPRRCRRRSRLLLHRKSPRSWRSFAFGGDLAFDDAMSSSCGTTVDVAFCLEEALSAPLPPSPPGYTDSLLRPQLGDTTVDWPQVPLDQLVDVAHRSIGLSSLRRRRRRQATSTSTLLMSSTLPVPFLSLSSPSPS